MILLAIYWECISSILDNIFISFCISHTDVLLARWIYIYSYSYQIVYLFINGYFCILFIIYLLYGLIIHFIGYLLIGYLFLDKLFLYIFSLKLL